MSVALAHAIPPPPPQPVVLPAQVQAAQGSTVPVPAIAVTAGEKGSNPKEAKNETGPRPDQGDRQRGKLVDIYA